MGIDPRWCERIGDRNPMSDVTAVDVTAVDVTAVDVTAVDVTAVDGADIFDGEHLVARLRYDGAATTFAYTAEWIRSDGRPASLSLPVAGPPDRRQGRSIPPALAGLLPEGRRLTATYRAIKTSSDDELSLLLAVGGDVVGHLRVALPGEQPAPVLRTDTPRNLGEEPFAAVFARAVGADPDLVGLGGVQDKVSGRMINLALPTGRAGVFLKLNPPEYPFLVENERFFLDAARTCGIRTATTTVVRDVTNAAGLLVERFDREGSVGRVDRVPCEDACQVLGRYPADKYRLETGEMFAALAERTGAPAVARANLFRQWVFAVLSGNGDAHGKNFSLVHKEGEWALSPAYDLPSTYPYGDSRLALPVNGHRPGQVSRRPALLLAESMRLPSRAAVSILDEVLDGFHPWIERVTELPFDANRAHDLRRFLRSRHRMLTGER